jgi:hypothetical protein
LVESVSVLVRLCEQLPLEILAVPGLGVVEAGRADARRLLTAVADWRVGRVGASSLSETLITLWVSPCIGGRVEMIVGIDVGIGGGIRELCVKGKVEAIGNRVPGHVDFEGEASCDARHVEGRVVRQGSWVVRMAEVVEGGV